MADNVGYTPGAGATIAALDRQARDLATIDRISALLGGIAELQARAWADDDDLTILLMVM